MQRENVIEARGPDLVIIEKKNRKTVKLQMWQFQRMKGWEQSREGEKESWWCTRILQKTSARGIGNITIMPETEVIHKCALMGGNDPQEDTGDVGRQKIVVAQRRWRNQL